MARFENSSLVMGGLLLVPNVNMLRLAFHPNDAYAKE